jgi:hypothetical protein
LQPDAVDLDAITLGIVLLLVWLMGGVIVADPVTWPGAQVLKVMEAEAGPAKASRPAVATAPASDALDAVLSRRNKLVPLTF